MNHEQLSFFNQQLAAMLQAGLPLEGSLKQLASSMRRGALRDEIEALERDLELGAPLEEALGRRRLPELYVAMLRAGIKGNNLPGMLTQAADYYGNLHSTWLRLKGLMVYPALVLVTSLVIAVVLAVVYTHMLDQAGFALSDMLPGRPMNMGNMMLQIWLPVIFLAVTTAAFFLVLSVRRMRHFARWKVPGFREASLAQLAGSLAMMLEHGSDLDAALAVAETNESGAPARRELALWRQRLAGGAQRFADIASPGKIMPPLFIWLVAGAGENLARGFRRAATVYDARARYRIELALYAALPVTIVALALLVGLELSPVLRGFIQFMNSMIRMDFAE